VYSSKSGFTETYAQWIGQELGSDVVKIKQARAKDLRSYDAVIYGGGLYISGIRGVRWLKRHLKGLDGKPVIVFATGASPPRPETIVKVRNKNFNAEQQRNIAFFYLRGGFDFRRLNPVDKGLMTLLKWRLLIKRRPNTDERGMLSAYKRPQNFTKKDSIRPLIRHVRQLRSP